MGRSTGLDRASVANSITGHPPPEVQGASLRLSGGADQPGRASCGILSPPDSPKSGEKGHDTQGTVPLWLWAGAQHCDDGASQMLGRKRQVGVEVSPDPDAPKNPGGPLAPPLNGATVDREVQGSNPMLLGQLLVERGLITDEQLRAVTDDQPESPAQLGNLLVESGAIEEYVLVQILGEYLELPVADLRQWTPEPLALDLLPESTARTRLALPLRIVEGHTDGHIDIAVAEPTRELERLLASATGQRVRLFVSPAADLRRAIDTHYRALGGITQLVQAFEALEGRPVARASRRTSWRRPPKPLSSGCAT